MIYSKVSLDSIPADAIVTHFGNIVTPLRPDPEQIFIEDIAYSLAGQTRFTGHTRVSTAQHSVLVSGVCDFDDALAGLLHDATEAYISDIARPLKKNDSYFAAEYREVECLLAKAIGDRFGVTLEPLPASVKWADDVLLRSEIRDHMPFEPYPGDFLPFYITPWTPDVAELKFLDRYYDLCD